MNMKIDFDIDSIRKQHIWLLPAQIDLILRSLEFYLYTYNYIYPRRGESESLEANLRKSLVRDTWEQITSEINNDDEINNIINFENKNKKVA